MYRASYIVHRFEIFVTRYIEILATCVVCHVALSVHRSASHFNKCSTLSVDVQPRSEPVVEGSPRIYCTLLYYTTQLVTLCKSVE